MDTLADAYAYRTDITEVCIPVSVNSIGRGAFQDCSGITALHLEEGLESIGSLAFGRCAGILLHEALPQGKGRVPPCTKNKFASCEIKKAGVQGCRAA